MAQSLDNQIFDIDGYRQILEKFSDQLVFLVDARPFQKAQDPAEIFQEICTELYNVYEDVFPDVDIPKVSDLATLRMILTSAKRRMNRQSWILILHADFPLDPIQELISQRQDCHWINLSQLTVQDFEARVTEYLAIER